MCFVVFFHKALQQSEIHISLLLAFFSAKPLWCDNVFMRRRGATSAKRPLQIMVRTVNHYAKHNNNGKQWQKHTNMQTMAKNTNTNTVNHYAKHTNKQTMK